MGQEVEIRLHVEVDGQDQVKSLGDAQTGLNERLAQTQEQLGKTDQALGKLGDSAQDASEKLSQAGKVQGFDATPINAQTNALKQQTAEAERLVGVRSRLQQYAYEKLGQKQADSENVTDDGLDRRAVAQQIQQEINRALGRVEAQIERDSLTGFNLRQVGETPARVEINRRQRLENQRDELVGRAQDQASLTGADPAENVARIEQRYAQLLAVQKEVSAAEKDVAGLRERERILTETEAVEKRILGLEQSELGGVAKINAERQRYLQLAKTDEQKQRVNTVFDGRVQEEESQPGLFRGRNLAQNALYAAYSPSYAAFGAASELASSFGPVAIGTTTAALVLGQLGKKLVEFIPDEAAAAKGLEDFASRLGLTVNQASALSAEAKIAGVNIESLAQASRYLSQAIEDPAGAGRKTATALHEMGVALYDATGQERELGQVTLDVIQKLAQYPTTAERAYRGTQTLGRGFKEIEPFVERHVELQKAANELGYGNVDELTNKLSAANDEIGKMSLAWELFQKELAAEIAPIVIPVIRKVTTFFENDPADNPEARYPGKQFSHDYKERVAEVGLLDAQSQIRARDLKQTEQTAASGIQPVTDAIAKGYFDQHANEPDELRYQLNQVQQQLRVAEGKLRNPIGIAPEETQKTRDSAESLRTQVKQLQARIKAAEHIDSSDRFVQNSLDRLAGEDARFRYPASEYGRLPELQAQEKQRLDEIASHPKLSTARRNQLSQATREQSNRDIILEARRVAGESEYKQYGEQRVNAQASQEEDRRQFALQERLGQINAPERSGDPGAVNQAYEKQLQLAQKIRDENLAIVDAEVRQQKAIQNTSKDEELAKQAAGIRKQYAKDQADADAQRIVALAEIAKRERDAADAAKVDIDAIHRQSSADDLERQFGFQQRLAVLENGGRETPGTIASGVAAQQQINSAQFVRQRQDAFEDIDKRKDLTAAEKEDEKAVELAKLLAQYHKQDDEARLAAAEKYLELQQQGLEEAKQQGAALFDALRNHQTAQFFRDQIDQIGRNVFANATAPIIQQLGKTVSGAFPNTGIFKDAFKGTLFDDPTRATKDNTTALQELTAAIEARLNLGQPSGVSIPAPDVDEQDWEPEYLPKPSNALQPQHLQPLIDATHGVRQAVEKNTGGIPPNIALPAVPASESLSAAFAPSSSPPVAGPVAPSLTVPPAEGSDQVSQLYNTQQYLTNLSKSPIADSTLGLAPVSANSPATASIPGVPSPAPPPIAPPGFSLAGLLPFANQGTQESTAPASPAAAAIPQIAVPNLDELTNIVAPTNTAHGDLTETGSNQDKWSSALTDNTRALQDLTTSLEHLASLGNAYSDRPISERNANSGSGAAPLAGLLSSVAGAAKTPGTAASTGSKLNLGGLQSDPIIQFLETLFHINKAAAPAGSTAAAANAARQDQMSTSGLTPDEASGAATIHPAVKDTSPGGLFAATAGIHDYSAYTHSISPEMDAYFRSDKFGGNAFHLPETFYGYDGQGSAIYGSPPAQPTSSPQQPTEQTSSNLILNPDEFGDAIHPAFSNQSSASGSPVVGPGVSLNSNSDSLTQVSQQDLDAGTPAPLTLPPAEQQLDSTPPGPLSIGPATYTVTPEPPVFASPDSGSQPSSGSGATPPSLGQSLKSALPEAGLLGLIGADLADVFTPSRNAATKTADNSPAIPAGVYANGPLSSQASTGTAFSHTNVTVPSRLPQILIGGGLAGLGGLQSILQTIHGAHGGQTGQTSSPGASSNPLTRIFSGLTHPAQPPANAHAPSSSSAGGSGSSALASALSSNTAADGQNTEAVTALSATIQQLIQALEQSTQMTEQCGCGGGSSNSPVSFPSIPGLSLPKTSNSGGTSASSGINATSSNIRYNLATMGNVFSDTSSGSGSGSGNIFTTDSNISSFGIPGDVSAGLGDLLGLGSGASSPSPTSGNNVGDFWNESFGAAPGETSSPLDNLTNPGAAPNADIFGPEISNLSAAEASANQLLNGADPTRSVSGVLTALNSGTGGLLSGALSAGLGSIPGGSQFGGLFGGLFNGTGGTGSDIFGVDSNISYGAGGDSSGLDSGVLNSLFGGGGSGTGGIGDLTESLGGGAAAASAAGGAANWNYLGIGSLPAAPPFDDGSSIIGDPLDSTSYYDAGLSNMGVGTSGTGNGLFGSLPSAPSDGAGISPLGALGGAFQAFKGFSGFAHNGSDQSLTSGIGGALGTAAALDPEPISKAVLGVTSMVADVVSALMGNPRLQRQEAETAATTNAQLAGLQYNQAPITITQDASTGHAIAYNQFGTPTVSSDLTPEVYSYQRPVEYDPLHPQNLLFATDRTSGYASAPTLTLPGYATGGNPDPFMPSIVGEQGMEIFDPQTSGTILPHWLTSMLLNSGDSGSLSPSVRQSLGQAPRDMTPAVQQSVQSSPASAPQIHLHTHINAMDSQDVIRRAPDIATALSKMVTSGNHRIQGDIKNLVSPV